LNKGKELPAPLYLLPSIPASVVAVVVGLSLLPFALILLGFDFGVNTPVHVVEQLALLPEEDLLNNLKLMMVGPQLHTLLEWSAIMTAVLTALLAFSHFSMTANITTPVIGISLLCAGAMDAFHSLVASRMLDTVADTAALIPFSWVVARSFNALLVLLGVGTLLLLSSKTRNTNPIRFLLAVTAVFVLLGYLITQWCISASNIPVTIFPHDLIKRPFDVIPLVAYIFAGAFVFPAFKEKYPSVFSDSLVISTIPAIAVELHMVFGSAALYDSHYYAAHGLKVLAYLVPFFGLLFDYYATYQKDKLKTAQLHQTYRELEERTLQLSSSNKRLEKANHYKSEFMASMSHELRTPLNSVIGFTRILLKDVGEGELRRENLALESIYRNSTHLLGLINDILDLSKIDAGRMVLSEESIVVGELVNDIKMELTPLAERKKLAFTVENYARNISVVSDKAKLRQMLLNLGSNALKYTTQGSVVIRIETEKYGPLGDSLTIAFKDTGIGIADEDKKKLFTEFGRAEEVRLRSIEGSGLGLMITARLASLLGGYVDFDSVYGVGSEFRLHLALPQSVDTAGGRDTKWGQKGLAIVLLGVDAELTEAIEVAFKRELVSVFLEENPDAFIGLCEKVLPDVICFNADIVMTFGHDVLPQLCEHSVLLGIPKIALSINEDNKNRLLGSGADLLMLNSDNPKKMVSEFVKLSSLDISNVLLVGVEGEQGKTLEKNFQDYGIHVCVSHHADDAIAQARELKPDFLLVNLGDEKLDSTRLMVLLNSDEQCRKIYQIIYNGIGRHRPVVFSNEVQEELALGAPTFTDILSAAATLRRRSRASLMRIEALHRSLMKSKEYSGSAQVRGVPLTQQREGNIPLILVVEDSKDNSELMDWILVDAKLSHDTARNGREALNLVLEKTYGLLLLDINLPDINGREVARRLRATSSYSETPIIAVTVLSSKSDIDELKSCGINEVVSKPLDQEALLEVIHRYIA